MNQINAVTLGKLIAAHREGDEQKFKTYVDFIAKAYEEQGNDRAANIILSNYTGDYAQIPWQEDIRRASCSVTQKGESQSG